jgi:hypothetical protein
MHSRAVRFPQPHTFFIVGEFWSRSKIAFLPDNKVQVSVRLPIKQQACR